MQETLPPLKPISAGVNLGTPMYRESERIPFNGSSLGLNYVPATLDDPSGVEDYLNENQGLAHTFANWTAQTLSNTILGTVESLSYLGDLEQWGNVVTGQEQDYTNWLADAMKSAKEGVKEAAPIYRSDEGQQTFSPGSRSFWTSNSPDVIGSVMSLLIPAAVAGKLGKGASVLAGLGKEGQAISELSSTVLASRWAESTMEANQVFQDLTSKGISREDAGQAASRTFNTNWLLAVQDAFQYGSILKGLKSTTKAKSALGLAGEVSTQMMSEGAEEGLQFIFSEEAKKAGLSGGKGYFDNNFWSERLGDYIRSDEFKSNVALGALGGGIFSGMGPATQQAAEQVKFIRTKLLDKQKSEILDGLAKERANLVNDFGTSKKIDQDKLTKNALEHLANNKINKWQDTVEQLKSTAGIDSDARKTLDDHSKDLEFLIDANTNIRNSAIPKELQSQAVADQLDLRQTMRLGKEMGKRQQEIITEAHQAGEIVFPDIKNLQVTTAALQSLAKENPAYLPQFEQAKATLAESMKALSPEQQKQVVEQKTIGKEKELHTLTKQLFLAQEKTNKLKESIAAYSTPEGIDATLKEQKRKDEETRVKNLVNKKDVTKEELQQALEQNKDNPNATVIQQALEAKKEQERETNKAYVEKILGYEAELKAEINQLQPARKIRGIRERLTKLKKQLKEVSSIADLIRKNRQVQEQEVAKEIEQETYNKGVQDFVDSKKGLEDHSKYYSGLLKRFRKALQLKSDEELNNLLTEIQDNIKQNLIAFNQLKLDRLKGLEDIGENDVEDITLIQQFNEKRLVAVEEEIIARSLKEQGDSIILEENSDTGRYELKAKEIEEAFRNNTVKDVDESGKVFTIYDQKFVNLESNPLDALTRDDSGNIISATLTNEEGKQRTFRNPRIVDEIAFAILSTEVLKQGEREVTHYVLTEEELQKQQEKAKESRKNELVSDLLEIQELIQLLESDLQQEENELRGLGFKVKEVKDYFKNLDKTRQLKDAKQLEKTILSKIKQEDKINIKKPKKVKPKVKKNEITAAPTETSTQTTGEINQPTNEGKVETVNQGIEQTTTGKPTSVIEENNTDVVETVKPETTKEQELITSEEPVNTKKQEKEEEQQVFEQQKQAQNKETGTARTWLPLWEYTGKGKEAKLVTDEQGNPVLAKWYDEKGNEAKVTDIFLTDESGKHLWADIPGNKAGQKVVLVVVDDGHFSDEKRFKWTKTKGFRPTGSHNWVINVYLANEDGSIANEKPIAQLPSEDNEGLDTNKEATIQLRRAVINSPDGRLVTNIVGRNIGDRSQLTKKNSISALEFDHYFTESGEVKYGKTPFNPILALKISTKTGLSFGSLAENILVPAHIKAAVEESSTRFWLNKSEKAAGNLYTSRMTPEGNYRLVPVFQRSLNEEEQTWFRNNLQKSLQSVAGRQEMSHVAHIKENKANLEGATGFRSEASLSNASRNIFQVVVYPNKEQKNEFFIPVTLHKADGTPVPHFAVVPVSEIMNFLQGRAVDVSIINTKNEEASYLTPEQKLQRAQEGFKHLLPRIYRNVVEQKLNSTGEYTDVVSGQTYKDYYSFLNNTNTLTTTNPSDADGTAATGNSRLTLNPKPDKVVAVKEGLVVKEPALVVETPKIPVTEQQLIERQKTTVTLASSGDYYKENDKWYNFENKEVVDKFTIKQLEFGLQASLKSKGKADSNAARRKLREQLSVFKPAEGFQSMSDEDVRKFKALIGEEFVDVIKGVDRIYSTGGDAAFGIYYNGLIKLAQFGEKGTENHEHIHFHLDVVSTPKQKERILQEAKKVYGVKDDQQAEEKLAEDFRLFILSRGKMEIPTPKIRGFFNQLWAMLKSLIGLKTPIQQLFKDLQRPYSEKQKIEIRKNIAQKANEAQQDEMLRALPNFSSAQDRVLAIDAVKQDVFTSALASATELKLAGKVLPNRREIQAKDLLSNSVELEKLFEALKQQYLDDFLALQAKGEDNFTNEDLYKYETYISMGVPYKEPNILDERVNLPEQYIPLLNNWENTKGEQEEILGFKNIVIKSLKSYGFTYVEVDKGDKTTDGDDNVLETEENDNSKAHIHGQKAGVRSPKEQLSSNMKLFLASIPDPSGKKNILGKVKNLDPNTTYANLVQRLSNTKNPITKLEQLAQQGEPIAKTVFNTLNERVANGNTKLQAEFFTNFSLATNTYKTVDPIKGTIYDSDRGSLAKKLPSEWRKAAERIKLIKDNGEIDTKRYQNIHNKYFTGTQDQTLQGLVEKLHGITTSIGINLPESFYQQFIPENVRKENQSIKKLKGLLYGVNTDSLEDFLLRMSKDQESYSDHGGLEQLARLAKDYVENTTGTVFLSSNLNQMNPTNIPTGLNELERKAESGELQNTLSQDPLYRNNTVLSKDLKFVDILEFKDKKGAVEYEDRTLTQSIATQITAYHNQGSKEGYMPTLTPADKAHQFMFLNKKREGKDAKQYLYDVLYNTTLNEKYRITLLKKYEKFDNNGNWLLPNYLKNYSQRGKQFLYVPEINSIPGMTESILAGDVTKQEIEQAAQTKIQEAINKHIDDAYKLYLDKLEQEGLITRNEKGTIKTTKAFPNVSVDIAEMFYNSYASSIEIQKIVMGDMAQYKNNEDYSKRAYQISTPGYKPYDDPANPTAIKTTYQKDNIVPVTEEEIKEWVSFTGMSGKELEDYYGKMNKTDAASMTTIHGMRKLGQSFNWTQEHEDVYNFAWKDNKSVRQAIRDKGLSPEESKEMIKLANSLTIAGFKPFYYQHKLVTLPDGEKMVIVEQVKDAIFVITPELAAIHSGYKAIYDRMVTSNLDVYSMESTFKVGSVNDEHLLPNTEVAPQKYQIREHNLSDYKFSQLINPKVHTETSASQLMGLGMTNIDPNTDYYIPGKDKPVKGDELNRIFEKLKTEKIKSAHEELLNKLGLDETLQLSTDPKKREKQIRSIKAVLQESLNSKDMSPNYEEAVELILNEFNQVDFNINPGFPVYAKSFSGVFCHLFDNVLKQKFTGFDAINLPDPGVTETERQDELNWLRVKDGKLVGADIAVSIDHLRSLGLKWGTHTDMKGNIRWDSLSQDQKEALDCVVYRIPTSGAPSITPCRIAKILPAGYKGQVILSKGFPKQQGLDFDKDDSHIIMRATKEGKIDNSHVDTKIFNTIWAKITNKKHGKELFKPLDIDVVDLKHKDLTAKGLIQKSNIVPTNPVADLAAEFRNKESGAMIGIAARFNKLHTFLQHLKRGNLVHSKVRLNIQDSFNPNYAYQLGNKYTSSGTLISEQVQQLMQAILDNAKDPKVADLNWLIYTAPTGLNLLLHGVDANIVMDFLKQPVVSAWLAEYNKNGRNKAAATQTILTEYNLPKNVKASISSQELSQFLPIEGNEVFSANVLSDFLHYSSAGSALSDMSAVFSVDTFKNLNVIEQIESLEEKKDVLTNPNSIIHVDPRVFDVNHSASDEVKSVAAYFTYAIGSVLKFNQNFFPETNPSYKAAQDRLKNVQGLKGLDVKTKQAFNKFLNFYTLITNPVFNSILDKWSPSSNSRWSYTGDNNIWEYTTKLSNKHNDIKFNQFIKQLQKVNTDQFVTVGLTNTNGTVNKQMITEGWRDLLNHPEAEVRQLGYDYIRYAIITSGLAYSTNSFFEHVPPEFWVYSGIENLQKQILKSLIPAEQDGATSATIDPGAVQSFIRHKYERIDVVPELKWGKSDRGVWGILDPKTVGNSTHVTEFKLPKDHYLTKEARRRTLPDFVKIKDGYTFRLYEQSPVFPGYYKEVQPLGEDRRITEVQIDGRNTSTLKLNRDFGGSPHPFKEGPKVTVEGVKEVGEPISRPEINVYSTDKNGYELLSNLLNGPVKEEINGKEFTFKTVEHAYQTKKALFAGDKVTAKRIVESATGWDAQRLSKQITGLNSEAWDKISSQELKKSMQKAFDQNQKAKDLLISTGNAKLTHTTPKFNLGKWQTEFPKLLMEIRDSYNNSIITQHPLTGEQGENPYITKYLPTENETAESIIDRLLEQEKDVESLEVLKALKRNVSKINTPVQSIPLEGKLGVFEVKVNELGTNSVIKINPLGKVESDSQMRVVLTHELNHAYSVSILDNPVTEEEKYFARNIERVFKEAKAKLGTVQGTENKYEFLATLASDKSFREKVRKTEGLWERIVKYFRNLLGLGDKYSKLLNSYFTVLDNAQNLNSTVEGAYALEEKKGVKKDVLDELLKSFKLTINRLQRDLAGKEAVDNAKERLKVLEELSKTDRGKTIIERTSDLSKELDELEKAIKLMKVDPSKANGSAINAGEQQLVAYDLLRAVRAEIRDFPEAYGFNEEKGQKAVARLNDILSRVVDAQDSLKNIRRDHLANLIHKEFPHLTLEQLRGEIELATKDSEITWSVYNFDAGIDANDPYVQYVAKKIREAEAERNRAVYEFMHEGGKKKNVVLIEIDKEGTKFEHTFGYVTRPAYQVFKDLIQWGGNKPRRDLFAPILDSSSFREGSTALHFISPLSKEGKAILAIKDGSPDVILRHVFETFVLGSIGTQDDIPYGARPGTQLPSVGRTILEAFLDEKGIKVLDVAKEGLMNELVNRYEDSEFKARREDGSPDNSIPIRFISTHDGKDGRYSKNEISLDVLNTVALAIGEHAHRKSLKANLSDLEMIEKSLKDRKVTQTRAIKGKGIESSLTREREADVDQFGDVVKLEGADSYSYKMVNSMMKRLVWGEFKEKGGSFKFLGKEIGGRKALDLFLKYTGAKYMFGSIAIPLTNLLVGKLTVFREAVGGNVIDLKDLAYAEKYWFNSLMPAAKDMNKLQKESKQMRILQYFNPTGFHRPDSSTAIDSSYMRRALMNVIQSDITGFEMLSTTVGATFNRFKITNPEGKEVPFDQGITVDNNGKISLEKGFKYKGKSTLETKDIDEVRDYIQRLYQMVYGGGQQRADSPAIKASMVGAAILFMRDWLRPGINSRWQLRRTDERLKTEIEGNYISSLVMMNNIFTSEDSWFNKTVRAMKVLTFMSETNPETLLLPNELDKPESEKKKIMDLRLANMRKTRTELLLIASTLLLLAFAWDDDDEDSFAQLMTTRVKRELLTFASPFTAWDVLKSPSVALSSAEGIMRAVGSTFQAVGAITPLTELDKTQDGELKVIKNWEKAFPAINKLKQMSDESIESQYRGLNIKL